jgi:membrane associated rhomboid family serine protease
MLFPYGDNLAGGRSFIGVLLLLGLMLAIDLPAFFNEALDQWSIRNLAFYPILFSIWPWRNLYRLISSAFLHADVFHLLGNGLFLWVFGRSLERLFGLPLFLAIFPFLGATGLLVHWALFPDSNTPVIGASGAISTLMGGYVALFPKARMKMLAFLGVAFKRFEVPAWTFLFYWGGLQMLSLALGSGTVDSVAYAVHVGGLAAGILSAMIWKVSYPSADERLGDFVQAEFSR